MEGVVGGVDDVKRRAIPKLCAKRAHKGQVGQSIASPLQKQNRQVDMVQVLSPPGVGPPGWVQRKTEENQAPNPHHDVRDHGGRLFREYMRRHPSTERFAARKQWQIRRSFCCCGSGGAHSGREYRRRVRASAPPLHVRKLVAEGGHSRARKFLRQVLHEGMSHPSARAVRQDQQGTRFLGPLQQGSYFSHRLRHAQC
jgi:hypothetical protein